MKVQALIVVVACCLLVVQGDISGTYQTQYSKFETNSGLAYFGGFYFQSSYTYGSSVQQGAIAKYDSSLTLLMAVTTTSITRIVADTNANVLYAISPDGVTIYDTNFDVIKQTSVGFYTYNAFVDNSKLYILASTSAKTAVLTTLDGTSLEVLSNFTLPGIQVVNTADRNPTTPGIYTVTGETTGFGKDYHKYLVKYDYINQKVTKFITIDGYGANYNWIPIYGQYIEYLTVDSAHKTAHFVDYDANFIATTAPQAFSGKGLDYGTGAVDLSSNSTLVGVGFLGQMYEGGVVQLSVTSTSPTTHQINVLGTLQLPNQIVPDYIGLNMETLIPISGTLYLGLTNWGPYVGGVGLFTYQ